MSEEGQLQGSRECRARHVYRAPQIRGAFDRTVIWEELLFSHQVFKFISVTLSKATLLGDVDLLAARELELGSMLGLSHVLLVLQLGADGYGDLAGHWALGLSKGTSQGCLEPRLGTA